jgi:hypothetical protein
MMDCAFEKPSATGPPDLHGSSFGTDDGKGVNGQTGQPDENKAGTSHCMQLSCRVMCECASDMTLPAAQMIILHPVRA